ncbi:MAG: 6-carboxytetrahydropterin synthase [Bdellovibrio sp.]|nr:6-carboxytetrahydropterin synthase [Bdellovibrio sp.]
MKRILVVSSNFSSAHLYKNDDMTDAQNRRAFGRCYTDHGHGHNYKLETGFLIDPKLSEDEVMKTKNALEQSILSLTTVLDHEHLNFVIPEFQKTVPTTENILLYFEKKLLALKLKNKLAFIKLFEMENLYSEKYYVTVY